MRYKNLENHLVTITNESVTKKLSMTKQRSSMENVYLLSDQFQVLVHLYLTCLMYQLMKFHQKDRHITKKRTQVRFSAKQKDYLNRRFNEGETTSAKVNASDISK